MNITYLILFNLALACWLGLYALIFSRSTFFKMNRFILLGGILVAALVPLVHPVQWIRYPVAAFPGTLTPVVVRDIGTPAADAVPASDVFPFRFLIMMIYWSGAAVMTLVLVRKLAGLYGAVKKFPHRLYADHLHVITPDDYPVFSFAKYLFAPSDIPEMIYRHELIHIRQKHTVDNLLLEVVKIFCWFNPAVYLYQRSVKTVHEYLADALATQDVSKKEYAHLLIGHLFRVPETAITHHFFNRSLLQKRLIMLQKRVSPSKAGWKYLLIVPLLVALIFISASSFVLHDKVDHAVAVMGLAGVDQPVTVRGMVTNQAGKPLSKVSVMQVGSTRGTITDSKGHFELRDVPLNGMLRFSMIGYTTITAVIEGNKKFHLTMYEEPTRINQVVVVGYTEQKTASASSSQHNRLDPVVVKGFGKEGKITPASPASSPGQLDPVVVEGYGKEGKINPASPAPQPGGKIFTFVEQMPQFPGGKADLMKFLRDHIRYPQQARKLHLHGNVLVSFVVGEDGRISRVQTVNDPIGGGLEQEAVRVVNAMPAWRPGRQNGDAVPVLYTLPIRFVLQ